MLNKLRRPLRGGTLWRKLGFAGVLGLISIAGWCGSTVDVTVTPTLPPASQMTDEFLADFKSMLSDSLKKRSADIEQQFTRRVLAETQFKESRLLFERQKTAEFQAIVDAAKTLSREQRRNTLEQHLQRLTQERAAFLQEQDDRRKQIR